MTLVRSRSPPVLDHIWQERVKGLVWDANVNARSGTAGREKLYKPGYRAPSQLQSLFIKHPTFPSFLQKSSLTELLNVSPVDSHPVLRKNAGLRHRPLSLRRHAPGCPISPGRRRPRLPGSPHRDYEEGMSRSSSLAISAMPPSLSPIPYINFPPHNVVNGQLKLTCPGSLERLRKYTDRQSLKTAHPDNASSKNATLTALVPLPAVVVDAGLPAISPARTPLRLLEVVSTACPFTMERFDTIDKFGRSWYGLAA